MILHNLPFLNAPATYASDRSQILYDAGKVSKKVKTFTDEGGCIVTEMSELL